MRIAIASGKGGTGKTTLATNLAALLAETDSVVLTDLDVEEPNSALFLKKNGEVSVTAAHRMVPQWESEKCILCGNCQKVCNFNAIIQLPKMVMPFPQLCHGCYACAELCPSGALKMVPERMGEISSWITGSEVAPFRFVEGKLDVGQEIAVPLIAATIKAGHASNPDGDFFICDAPPGTSCPMIEAVKDAEFVLLVTEPTPFGFHDLKLAVETVRKLEKDFAVVINKHGIGNEQVEAYCKEEGITISAKLPNDRAIATLYAAGKSVYRDHAGFRQELEKLARFLNERRVQV